MRTKFCDLIVISPVSPKIWKVKVTPLLRRSPTPWHPRNSTPRIIRGSRPRITH